MGLDRIGTFRCRVQEWGVDARKKKGTEQELPWFNVRVLLTEYYDPTEGEWFDYTDQEAEITAYLCLYGAVKKKGGAIGPTLSYDQVKKVFSWDGVSFAALANGNYSELDFQVRIGENTYEAAVFPYQVNWINEYGADPVNQLRKLDAAELKDLDKQFAKFTKTPVKVATVTKPHPARVPADDVKPISPAEKRKILKEKSVKNKAAAKAEAKATVPTAPEPASSPPEAPEPTEETCDKNEAWCTIVELRDPTIDDGTIKELWNVAIEEVAGPKAVTKEGQEKITGKQWYQVKELVLKDCAKF